MKKIIFLFCSVLIMLFGCKSDDNPTTPPSTGEVFMANVPFDSIGTSGGGTSSLSQTVSLTSSQLNFTDRDSARISFSYKGSSTANDTLFYISTGTSRLYTLKDSSPLNTYKSINVTVPAIKVNAFFQYTIQAKGTGPYITIKDLNVYKK